MTINVLFMTINEGEKIFNL